MSAHRFEILAVEADSDMEWVVEEGGGGEDSDGGGLVEFVPNVFCSEFGPFLMPATESGGRLQT